MSLEEVITEHLRNYPLLINPNVHYSFRKSPSLDSVLIYLNLFHMLILHPSLLYNGYRVFPGVKAARAWR